ncbi:hypothetical protein ACGFW5_15865 [Streptomyces sp. NPDC048416]
MDLALAVLVIETRAEGVYVQPAGRTRHVEPGEPGKYLSEAS